MNAVLVGKKHQNAYSAYLHATSQAILSLVAQLLVYKIPL